MSSADRKIAQVEHITGHTFSDTLLGAASLQMSGTWLMIQGKFQLIDNNKELAVLGDCVLDTVLCKMWYEKRDAKGYRLNRGDWSTIRKDKLGNDNFCRFGREVGIHGCILAAAGTTYMSDKMVATTVEAVFGAIFLDGGIEAVRTVVVKLGLNNHPFLLFRGTRDPRVVDGAEQQSPREETSLNLQDVHC